MGFGWCCGFGGGETFGYGGSVLLGIDLRWVLGVCCGYWCLGVCLLALRLVLCVVVVLFGGGLRFGFVAVCCDLGSVYC